MKSQFLILISASAVDWFLFSVLCFSAFAWVDRSGRGFNPRPAQGSAQDRLKILIFFPLFVRWFFRGAEDAAEEVDFRFVRFGAQY